jgi:hypothetical protein
MQQFCKLQRTVQFCYGALSSGSLLVRTGGQHAWILSSILRQRKTTPLKPLKDAQTEGSLPKWCNGSHVCLRSIYRKMWRFKSSLGHFKSCDLKFKNRIHKMGKKIPAKKSLKKLRA